MHITNVKGMSRMRTYDCLIVGGGIAGLQAAIQLGRYEHKVLVIDSGNGRSSLCRSYKNILGYPDGVSGEELRTRGRQHAEMLGVEFIEDEIVQANKKEEIFDLEGKRGISYKGKRLLLATGVQDTLPDFPNLFPCLGITVFICPDCDGYEIKNRKTIVIGSGGTGTSMALTLTYWTNQIILINHDLKEIPKEYVAKIKDKGITLIEKRIENMFTVEESQFRGIQLEGGEIIEAERAFIALGKDKARSKLASQLGVERLENQHILTDPRTKMTNVQHVWAAGDVGVHSELATIAMGEGMQSAIWIHKSLLNN